MGSTTDRPTAWVLAGGGSFGAIQVGMLRALVAYGLAPDLVIGSSVGAINGAYFAGAPDAAGLSQLEAIWCGLRRSTVFPLAWRSMLGLQASGGFAVDPSGLRRLLEQGLPYQALEDASVPMHVVATDLLGGGTVAVSRGPAVDAVLASCAIPAVFPPVRIGEQYLIDGAIASNTPISVAVELGAKRVIVLPTGFACALESPPHGAVHLAQPQRQRLAVQVGGERLLGPREFGRVGFLVAQVVLARRGIAAPLAVVGRDLGAAVALPVLLGVRLQCRGFGIILGCSPRLLVVVSYRIRSNLGLAVVLADARIGLRQAELLARRLLAREFEEGVVVEHLLDLLAQLQRRELQQPDRLLQLRRERQMLGDAKRESLFHHILKCSPRYTRRTSALFTISDGVPCASTWPSLMM